MQYADYRKKMIKLAGVLSALKRFRVLIISACLILVALVTTLLCIRGIVYEVAACPETIVYGEALGFRAKAVMGGVVYEYAEAGSEEWSQVEPVRAGSYNVRAYSKSVTGQPRYGGVHAFTILPKPVEVHAADYSVYGDDPELIADLCFEDTVSCASFTYDDKYAETTEVLPDKDSVVITDKNGADVTSSYIITTIKSEISIGKRTVTVAAESSEKEYDGTPLTASGYELGETKLAFGDVIRFAGCDGSLTNAGSVKNEIVGEVKIYNENNADVTDRYELSISSGTLTVNKRQIIVTSASAEKEYDGNELTCLEYSDDGRLVSGHTLSVSLYAGITDAGECENTLGFTVNGSGGNLTSNYDIQLEAGTLKVTPREITVTTQDKSFVYSGTAYSWDGHEVTCGSLVSGHSTKAYNLTDITNVGSVENLCDISVFSGSKDVTANYSVNIVSGTLTVTAATLVINSDDYSWTYDGAAHSWNGYTQQGLAEAHTITSNAISNITSVGNCDNCIEVRVFSGAEEVTENYSINYRWGTLKITARPVTVSADGAEKYFDGTALTCGTVSGDNLVSGHRVTATVSGSGTDAGQYSNTVKEGTVTIRDAEGADVTSNYAVTLAVGTLKVVPRPITVITADNEWVYDDRTHYDKTFKVAAALEFALVSGHVAVLQSYTEVCDAGAEENILSVKIFSGEKDVTSNYNITYDNGTLIVNPKEFTVTTGGGEWAYDDKTHFNDYFEYDGLISGHTVEVGNFTEITDAGTKDNEATVTITSGERDVTSNYDITFNCGTLKVTPKKITVTTADIEFVYDGEMHYNEDFEYDGLIEGHAIRALVLYARTNVGSYKNSLEVTIYCSGNGHGYHTVTENYDIEYKFGTVTVKPRPLIVTADSAEKQYDGSALTCRTFSVENLVSGHTFTAKTSGSQTEVGESANTVVADLVAIFDAAVNDVTYNYSITLKDGVLKVTPREITLKAGDAEKIYDGDPLTCASYEVISENKLNSGCTFYAQTSGSRTDVGESANVIVPTSVKISLYGKDITANFNIAFEEGTLTVTPRPITVIVADTEKEYDGTPLTGDCYGVGSDYVPALVMDHQISAVLSGSQTEVGVGVNTVVSVTITSFGRDVTANYSISIKDGKLTVTGRKITVTTAGGEWIYDGEEHYADGFEVDGLLKGHTAEAVSSTAIENAGTLDNIVDLKITCGDEDVTANYDVQYDCGTLTVTARTVNLTTGDGDWVYDGEAHSTAYAEVNGTNTYGLVEGHTLEYITCAEITDVGTTSNVLGISVFDGEKDVTANYDLHLTFGTLKVTKRPVTITYRFDKIYFTGAPVNQVISCYATSYFKSLSDYPLLNNSQLTVTVLCDEYELGAATLYFQQGSARFTDYNNKDLTANYEITLLSKEVTISKRTVNIASVEAEKVYDGTPLTAEDWKLSYTGSLNYIFVAEANIPGHVIEIDADFTGSQTEIGESLNTFTVNSFKVLDGNGNDVTYGYNVKQDYGSLYVTEFGSLYVTTSGAAKIYDGTPLTNDSYSVVSTLLDGYTYEVFVTGSRTEVGASANTFYVKVYSPEGVDVTEGLRLVSYCGSLWVYENDFPASDGGNVGDLDTSGGIGGDGSGSLPDENTVALRVYSEADGEVYMRLQSYGAYTGTGWNPANPYTGTIDGKYGMNYLTGFALGGADWRSVYMQVEVMGSMYYLPYYLASGDYGYNIQQSDVINTGNTSAVYSLYYYTYDYLKNGAIKLASDYLSEAELAYRQFVYDNYLAVPTTTAEYLKTVIAAQGFDASDSRLIAKIAAYVQSAATYNLNYNTALDNESDAVISFLRDYKEGVCRHYASAATLLYRMMGIPARYTIGYFGKTVAGEWVDVTTANAHAWVEIYIDGEGWVQIEVTGADESGYGEIELGTLTPADVTKEYDGTPLVANRLADNEKLAALLKEGFTYSVQFGGSLINVGTGNSWVSDFVLYDPDGKPVVSGVKWTSGNGLLTVVKAGTLITVHLYYLGCEYDGKGHSLGSGDWFAEGLPAGCYLEFDPSSIVVTAVDGFNWSALKSLPLHLYNGYGYDVTGNYNIIFSYESVSGCDGEGIDISRRQLNVCTQTAEKQYDGTPLTNSGWWISFGTLAEGHKIAVTVSGSITDVGVADNTVKNLKIVDADGRDVTDNYGISYTLGKLTVID